MSNTSKPLDVIALISGGKDSLYSLLHCVLLGHNVVALANLYPSPQDVPSDEDPDLNSYMYQTAGHKIVPLHAQALGIPLHRRVISGSASTTSKEYDPDVAREDETEDLTMLLKEVMAAHPSANAVSCGAIYSTYQRTRVESVAVRLGLTPLAFLWQYEKLATPLSTGESLLQDMGTIGLDARIVKVASGGLDESFLWENVCEQKIINRLRKAVGKFGGSILGEGGEFETIVVKGPKLAWKGEVIVAAKDRIVRRGSGGEAWLDLKKGHLVPVAARAEEDTALEPMERAMPRVHNDLEPRFARLRDSLHVFNSAKAQVRHGNGEAEKGASGREIVLWNSWSLIGSTLNLFNVFDKHLGNSFQDQVNSVLDQVQSILEDWGAASSCIIHTTVLLRSMSNFPAFNAIYGAFFTVPLPPSRVTIACGTDLPLGIHIVLSATATTEDARRQEGLHVQSRSFWAPANIGPYSQAISYKVDTYPARAPGVGLDPGIVFVAGQIPLIASTMEMHGTGAVTTDAFTFADRAVLALQYLWRIGEEMKVEFWTGAVAYLALGDQSTCTMQMKADIAWQCWSLAHAHNLEAEDESDNNVEEKDVWFQKHQSSYQTWVPETKENPLPHWDSMALNEGHGEYAMPGFFAVEVEALPRGSDIEWQSVGIKNGTYSLSQYQPELEGVSAVCVSLTDCASSFTSIAIAGADDVEGRVMAVREDFVPNDGVSCAGEAILTLYLPQGVECNGFEGTVVPCKRVWGANGHQLGAALTARKGV